MMWLERRLRITGRTARVKAKVGNRLILRIATHDWAMCSPGPAQHG